MVCGVESVMYSNRNRDARYCNTKLRKRKKRRELNYNLTESIYSNSNDLADIAFNV